MTDAERFVRFRAELIDDALDDFVGIIRICAWAREMAGLEFEDRSPRLLAAVTELLVSLIGHHEVAVVNGYIDCEFTDPVVLRGVLEAGWATNDGRPIDGQVAWVVARSYAPTRPLAPAEMPTPDAEVREVKDLRETLARMAEEARRRSS